MNPHALRTATNATPRMTDRRAYLTRLAQRRMVALRNDQLLIVPNGGRIYTMAVNPRWELGAPVEVPN